MGVEENFSSSTIIIWYWSDAPPQFRELSQHGGGETWIVMLPADRNQWPYYFITRDGEDYLIGWGHAEWHDYAEWHIVIFAHA